MNKDLYVMVADGGRAKVFRSALPPVTLVTVHDHINYVGRRTPQEEERFCRDLCKLLDTEAKAGRYDALVLVAPPLFLDQLRTHLSQDCNARLLKSVAQDLLKTPEDKLLEHLCLDIPELQARKAS